MARRALPVEVRRTVAVDFRISHAQRSVIEREAHAAGMRMPDYVRAVLTGQRRVSRRARRPDSARPAAWREDSRITVRMTVAEANRLRERAAHVSATVGYFARALLAGRRPRARHVRAPVVRTLIYELQSLAANFRQLHMVTRNPVYEQWRYYVGVRLPLALASPAVNAEACERHILPINRAGRMLNDLAWSANTGEPIKKADTTRVHDAVSAALTALVANLPPSATGRT